MTPRTQRLVDLGLMPAPTADELAVAAIQREQFIEAGLLRPDPNEALAESPWDRLAPLQIPGWWPVLRLAPTDGTRAIFLVNGVERMRLS